MKSIKYFFFTISILIMALLFYFFYPEDKLPKNIVANKIVVLKSKRQLILYSNDVAIKIYKISLGKSPIGHKQISGDNKTPEGIYSISNHGIHKTYHKYLHISYPNKNDRIKAAKLGKDPGSAILIHGLHKKFSFFKKIHRWYDWTRGCIAVTNEEIDEIYKAVKIGTKIEIRS